MATKDPDTAEIKMRVRGELRENLAEAAERHGMPLNAEIMRRLVDSFQLDAKLRELDAKLRELDAERDRMRSDLKIIEGHRAEAQARLNRLTDYVLELTSPKIPATGENT